MLRETIRLAAQTIARNALRSFLTVLGVVIGVAAVIAMVTIGEGSSRQVTASVASLGTNVLMVRSGGRFMGPGGERMRAPAFTLRDVAAVAELSSVGAVAPIRTSPQVAVYGNANAATSVTGSTNAFLTVGNWTIASGRAFTEAEEDSGAAVCIIGQTVRSKLFGRSNPVDTVIRIGKVSCTVAGLLEARGAGAMGQDQDDLVVMPIRAVQRRLAGSPDVSSMQVALAQGVGTERGQRDIETLMRERRRVAPGSEDNFTVMDMAQIASMLSSVNNVLTGLLSSVAAVSLLVGGIGIMNIMLVSVTERTREIGIRLAVGATARQVLTQFLVEAVVLSVIGGVIGVATGLGIAAIASGIMAIPFAPSAGIVALAFVFSGLVGVLFGYMPARRAARLDPIDALRHQ
ncbi:ABC transporter permease [Ruixingdingia sedimenti]|uniref:ABC transporter permease n=1 Tax=Ruixingdingia sedimenti TaxID=3073604 RepID=A0ABU1F7U2_9RHOB|nr:ABC transporter permease [Xinfangfangia sp. LG-4]MDR5652940.1 ABC transporter permease [Xinfangfangia sp. LG-4]